MKVFISQPIHGLTEKEILEIRTRAIEIITEINFNTNIEIIESYIHNNAPSKAGRLWHLGRSIQLLENVNAAYFILTPNMTWEDAHECQIEHYICHQYGIPAKLLNI